MSQQHAVVTLDQVSFRYLPTAPLALDQVTLGIPAQAVTAILGPNGSGKTTLMHLVLGLLSPTSGEMHLNGHGQGSYDRRALSRLMGLVPQNEELSFNLSVLEYVLLGRAPHLALLERPSPADRVVAWQALEATGIAHLWGRSVLSLSGGERQMAILSRALAQEPAVLLFDEPTSHLDVANTRRVVGVMRQLREQGRTIVFTTHAPNVAAAVADHVVLMREGRVLAAGPTAQVLTGPSLSETYQVEIQVAQVNGRLAVLEL